MPKERMFITYILRFKLLILSLIFFLISSTLFSQTLTLDSLQQEHRNSKDPEEQIIIESYIAFYLSDVAPDSALSIAKKALSKAEKLNFLKGIASTKNTIGWCFFRLRLYDEAVEYIKQSIAFYESMGDIQSMLAGYNNLSSIYLQKENYSGAINQILKVLPYLQAHPEYIESAYLYKNIATFYSRLQEYDESITYFKKVIELNEKLKSPDLTASTKISLGVVYHYQKDYKKAISLYEEAYEIHKKNNEIWKMGLARENMGSAYVELGKFEEALNIFFEVKEIYEDLESLDDVAYINFDIGKTYSHLGKYDLAIQSLKEGIILVQSRQVSNYEVELLLELSEVYQKKGDFENALNYYKDYHSLKDSIKKNEQVSELNLLRTQFETEHKDFQISMLNSEKELANQKRVSQLLIGLSILLVLLIVVSFLYVRNKLIQKEKLVIEQEMLLVERTQQETEQKLLRSQMNPHFIFNSLNTIESYVLQSRKFEASKLIQRFSRLTRRVLEHSERTLISVREDIQMLEDYLHIEKTRNNNQFEFEFKVDENAKETALPPMIIQPFVENALVHGIRNKEGNSGFVLVKVTINNDDLVIQVEDNGVGRKKAEAINKEYRKVHHSMAMTITTERLAKLNRGKKKEEYLSYKDKESPETGTIVTISIPIKKS